jgi:8-oxo-dGTP pyrophosphatase MutT (NUDIX family)
MPFTQRQAERMGWAGLAGGLAGGAAGLLAGLLYRRFRKGRLVKTLHDRLSKEASAWLRTNYPMTTNTSTGGKPISSSNRRLMLDQQPEYFSAGYIVDRGGRKLAQDMLPGGDADHADISKLPADQVLKGSVHETEHTKDPGLAVEIASDHVVEDPKYYDKLEKMEKEAGLINTSVMQRGVAQMLANLQKKPLAVPKPAKIAPITVPGTRATDTAAHMPSTVTNVERRLNPTVPTMWKGDIGATPKVTPPPGWNQLQDMRPSVLSALRGGRVTIGPMAEINESNRLLRGLAQRQERALTGVRPPVSAGPIPISPTSRLGQNMQQQAVSMNREQLLAALNRMERQNSPQALARTQQAAQQARQGALRGLGTAAGVVGATGAAASQVEAPGSQPAQSSTVQIAQPEQIQLPEGEPIQWAGSYSQPDNRKVAQVNDSGLILRERAEVIITSPDGVLAIKKPDYLLLPGGGLNEEETPQMAAIRETIEEADLLLEDPKPEGEVRVAYAGEGPSPGFNGELTHFFTSTAGEPLGVDHEDREDFTYIPFEEALIHLTECMLDEKNDWARDNNLKRAQLIERAMKEQAGVDKDLQEAEIVRADKIEKTADVPVLMPRSEYVLFNKDGKLVLRRRENRRFELPTQGVGRPAPYEPRIRYMPPEGVPEQGVHGYEVGLNVGEADQIPEGYEAVDPQAALKDLYASMGLKTNLPHQAIDRARSRVILRELKKRNKPAGVQNAA